MALKKVFGDLEIINGVVKNLNIEALDSDPSAPQDGRIWFNNTDKVFKIAMNGQIATIAAREDIISLINILKSTSAGQGSDVIGVQALSSNNLSVDAGKLTTVLQSLLNYIDSNLQEINNIKDGTTVVAKATDADTVDGLHASDLVKKTGDEMSGALTAPEYKVNLFDKDLPDPGKGYAFISNISSGVLTSQDGNGRIELKWNCPSDKSNEVFLVGDENAAKWIFGPETPDYNILNIYFADGSGKNAGDTIDNWQNILSVGLTTFKHMNNNVMVENHPITTNQEITLKQAGITFQGSTDDGAEFRIFADGEDLVINEPEDSNSEWMRFKDNDGLYVYGEKVMVENHPITTNQDIEITDATKGVILTDRSNGNKYRLYVEDGVLGIEEV